MLSQKIKFLVKMVKRQSNTYNPINKIDTKIQTFNIH